MAIRQVTQSSGGGLIPAELRDLMSLAVFMRQMTGRDVSGQTSLSLGSNFLRLAGGVTSSDSMDYQINLRDLLESSEDTFLADNPDMGPTYELTKEHVADVLQQTQVIEDYTRDFDSSVREIDKWRQSNDFRKTSGGAVVKALDRIQGFKANAVKLLSTRQYEEYSDLVVGLNTLAQTHEFLRRVDSNTTEEGIQTEDDAFGSEKIKTVFEMFQSPHLFTPQDIAREMKGVNPRQFSSVAGVNQNIQRALEISETGGSLKEVTGVKNALTRDLVTVNNNQVLTPEMRIGLRGSIEEAMESLEPIDRDFTYGEANDFNSFSRSIQSNLLFSDSLSGQSPNPLDLRPGHSLDGAYPMSSQEEIIDTINFAIGKGWEAKDSLQNKMLLGEDVAGEYAHMFSSVEDEMKELHALKTIFTDGVGEDSPNMWMHDFYKKGLPPSIVVGMYAERVAQGIDDPLSTVRFGKHQVIQHMNTSFQALSNDMKYYVWGPEIKEATKNYDIPYMSVLAPTILPTSAKAIDATTAEMLNEKLHVLDSGITVLAFSDNADFFGGDIKAEAEKYQNLLKGKGETTTGKKMSPLEARTSLVDKLEELVYDKDGNWIGDSLKFGINPKFLASLGRETQQGAMGRDIALFQKYFDVRRSVKDAMKTFPAMNEFAKTNLNPSLPTGLTDEQAQAAADSLEAILANQKNVPPPPIELTDEQKALLSNFQKVMPFNISLEGRTLADDIPSGPAGRISRDERELAVGKGKGPMGSHKLGKITEEIEKIIGTISKGETYRFVNKAYTIEDLPQSEEAFDEFVIEILKGRRPKLIARMSKDPSKPNVYNKRFQQYLNALKTHLYSPI